MAGQSPPGWLFKNGNVGDAAPLIREVIPRRCSFGCFVVLHLAETHAAMNPCFQVFERPLLGGFPSVLQNLFGKLPFKRFATPGLVCLHNKIPFAALKRIPNMNKHCMYLLELCCVFTSYKYNYIIP